MTTTTRALFKQDLLNLLNPRFSAKMRGFVMPLTFTANGGDTTHIRDTRLDRSSVGANDYDRHVVEIVSDAGAGPAIGEARGVTNAGYDLTDKLTVSPAFSAQPLSGDSYNLYPPEISPEQLNEAIARLLRTTEAPALYWPTIMPSFVLSTGLIDATNWPDVGSPTATALVSSSAHTLWSEYAAKSTSADAGEGFQSLAQDIDDAESLLLSTFVRVTAGGFDVELYDETNGTVFAEAAAIASGRWQEIQLTEAIPSGCKQFRVRYLGTADASEIYVAEPCVVQYQIGGHYTMPSWFTRENQYRQAVIFPNGIGGDVDNAYIAVARGVHPAGAEVDFIRNDRAVNTMLATFNAHAYPLAFLVDRAFDTLSSDTATSPISRDYVLYQVAALIMESEGDSRWRGYARRAAALRRANHYGERRRSSRDNTRRR